MVVRSRWVLMKSRHGEPEEKALQVYGDKFTEYDVISNLAIWLNRSMPEWNYWIKELVEDG